MGQVQAPYLFEQTNLRLGRDKDSHFTTPDFRIKNLCLKKMAKLEKKYFRHKDMEVPEHN